MPELRKDILSKPVIINAVSISGVSIKVKEGSKIATPKQVNEAGVALWGKLIKRD
jgi:hypothetical protein